MDICIYFQVHQPKRLGKYTYCLILGIRMIMKMIEKDRKILQKLRQMLFAS